MTNISGNTELLYRPEIFFRSAHPKNTRGRVVLQRHLGTNTVNSFLVDTKQLEKIARTIIGTPEIFFSTASFLGTQLILNFDRTFCLHLQIPIKNDFTQLDVTDHLGSKGIPAYSATISDPKFLTMLWFLDKPFLLHEFHTYHMLQRYIYNAAHEFGPTKKNLDLTFLTRFPGTKTKQNDWIYVRPTGKIHNKHHLEQVLLNNNTARDYKNAQHKAGIFLELRSLLHELWWGSGIPESLRSDWLIFFASSLGYFCTPEQLFKELVAIAESLSNTQWKNISEEYQPLITSLSETAHQGYVSYDNIKLSTDYPEWATLIGGKIASKNLLQELNLDVLLGKDTLSPYLAKQDRIRNPFGKDEFSPIERIAIKAV